MHYSDIIYGPVITEKSTVVTSDGKTYVFKCNKKANKNQIKDAVEKAFNVHVVNVNTLNTKAKRKRVGRYAGYTKTYKKAYVTLKDGDKIELS